MKIYKQQRKTVWNPADDLRDTFSAKEIDFLCTYNHNSPLYKLEANRNDYLWDWHVEDSRISRKKEWIEFPRVDDFIVTMGILLNGNDLNLDDKKYNLLKKVVKKVVVIRYRNILENKKEYKDLGCLVF